MNRMRRIPAAAVALALGLSVAATGCGKYSWPALKAQKAWKDGGTLYKSSDWKGAADRFEVAIANDPSKAEVFFYLGNCVRQPVQAEPPG